MSLALVVAVGGLVAVGTYLVTSRILSRIVLGVALLGHAAVLALVAAGGPAGDPPLVDSSTSPADAEDLSNPLPQALSLTAIVISFGLTLFVLALARRQHELSGDDLVEDDLEDRRIAGLDVEVHTPIGVEDDLEDRRIAGLDDAPATGAGPVGRRGVSR